MVPGISGRGQASGSHVMEPGKEPHGTVGLFLQRNHVASLAAQAQDLEKMPELCPSCTALGSERVSPAHVCVQAWLAKTSLRACTLAAREYEKCEFFDFP